MKRLNDVEIYIIRNVSVFKCPDYIFVQQVNRRKY